jgi:hypothetical protein
MTRDGEGIPYPGYICDAIEPEALPDMNPGRAEVSLPDRQQIGYMLKKTISDKQKQRDLQLDFSQALT